MFKLTLTIDSLFKIIHLDRNKGGILLGFKESVNNSRKFLGISSVILIIMSTIIYLLSKIDVLNSLINTTIALMGFSATIYSVFLTIVLFRFISLSDAEFVLNSNLYVERNKQEIIAKILRLSNFMRDEISDKHSEVPKTKLIPGEIRDDLIYIKTLNKKHVNERTSLYQCKESFNTLENLITETRIHEIADYKNIEVEKIVKILEVLIELTTNLDTIFNNKEG